jgi:hypothetical protein
VHTYDPGFHALTAAAHIIVLRWSYRPRSLPPPEPAPPTELAVPLGVPDPLGIGPSGIGGGPPTPIAVAIAIENPKDGFPALNDVVSAPHFLHRAAPLASDDVCCMFYVASPASHRVAAQRSAAQHKPHMRFVACCISCIASDRNRQHVPGRCGGLPLARCPWRLIHTGAYG